MSVRIAALCVALLAAGSVQAATYNASQQSANSIFEDTNGNNAWYQHISYKANGITKKHVAAGLFRLKTLDNGNLTDFVAFCLSPTTDLNLNTTYEPSPTLGLTSTAFDELGALVSGAWSLVTNSQSAAAFQIAAWEIVTENGGALNLGSGNFKLTSANNGTKNLAASWLGDVTHGPGAFTPGASFTLLKWTTKRSQNLITASLVPPSVVPVPATGVLMLAAFGALAALRRRKTAMARVSRKSGNRFCALRTCEIKWLKRVA